MRAAGAGAGESGRSAAGSNAQAAAQGGRAGSATRANAGGAGQPAAAASGEPTNTSPEMAGSAGGAPASVAGSGGAAAANGGTGGADASGGAGAAASSAGAGGSVTGGHGGSAGSRAPADPDPDATLLSDTDQTPDDIALSPDRLGAEWLTGSTAGVRSTRAVMPGSGVYYFEAVAPVDYFDIGVAPMSARLDQPAGAADSGGFSVNVIGYYAHGTETSDFKPAPSSTFGIVVDYRGAQPTIYLIGGASKPGELVTTQSLSVTQPLYIHLSGQRRMPGIQVRINPGNDTVNFPLTLDPAAVLNASGHADVANALVPGWSRTKPRPLNAAPVLTLEGSQTSTIALGESVTFKASASDAEDGELTQRITWDVLSEGNGPERVRGDGGSFSFKPNAIGQHPIQVAVVDAGGKQDSETLTVNVTGTLQQFDPVKLVLEPDLSGDGIQLDADGLRAHWTVDQKNGVRANQGLYGDFQYVEGHRLGAPQNQAIGLVIGHVTLNPYQFNIAPPSCSVNNASPQVSVWQDLISVAETGVSADSAQYYGLAVDYREKSPTVYVIVSGKVIQTLHLTDVTVPIYPMLYGNVTGASGFDMEINFGAKPFHEDVMAALSAAGVSTSGLKLCWGNACR